MMNLIGSICLSDVPQKFVRIGKDGKKYLPVYIGQRRQPSQYGHTHFVKVYVPKDRREEGVEYFIGEAKPSEYQTQQSRVLAGAESFAREQQNRAQYRQPEPVQPSSFDTEDETGDLPF
ncbi:MAG: hypothetical protein IJK73_01160 [Bacteroidales bacterium]|nr:hypothetical protein [Bacteroidales bacterium]